MWTLPGREFPAPTFELGMARRRHVFDRQRLALFLRAAVQRRLHVDPANPQAKRWNKCRPNSRPQAKTGISLGFFVGDHKGRRRVGHDGAMYASPPGWRICRRKSSV